VILFNYAEAENYTISLAPADSVRAAKNMIGETPAQAFVEEVDESEILIVHPHQSNCYESTANGSWVTLVNSRNATDPTYNELIKFIKLDKTDEIEYDYNNFVCADFAQTVHNNAENVGIKAAWVSIEFEDKEYGHACNAFNTTDRGMIFIDCTGADPYKSGNWDSVVKIEIGERYRPRELFNKGSVYEAMGLIKNYNVYW